MVIYAEIDEKLEKEFKIKVIEKYGSGKMKIALEEAIRHWMEKN
jgi:hypothetical protein